MSRFNELWGLPKELWDLPRQGKRSGYDGVWWPGVFILVVALVVLVWLAFFLLGAVM